MWGDMAPPDPSLLGVLNMPEMVCPPSVMVRTLAAADLTCLEV
jgi:hypothetical protein